MSELQMAYTTCEPTTLFDQEVTAALQQALYQQVPASISSVQREVRARFHPALAKNIAGSRLRTEIEHRLLGLPGRYPMVTADVFPNSTKSHHHVQLRCGKIVLTAAKTEGPGQLPRDADYRNQLLAAGGMALFQPPDEAGDPVFCLLAYGVVFDGGLAALDFVNIVFPHPNGVDVAGMIDLGARYGMDDAASPSGDAGTSESEERLVRAKQGSKERKTG